ncbi:hypothetical protein [Polaribacter tangerinus]|uniref:hypothetical protein n=1 Tax=Polaribacter tangerinus TaxID=1920034 RepID=UPI000B4A8856|nr:hypothetical protein [Polaribacter tangerinus]
MLQRIFSFLMVLIICTSCDYFTFSGKNKNLQEVDTLVDFFSVDSSPSFKICDSIIEKKALENCFRNTLHNKLGAALQTHHFSVKDSISETVLIGVLINSKGNVAIDNIDSSLKIKEQLPELDSILTVTLHKLSPIFPAVKRGIPVTTKYTLPIKIHLQE